MLRRKSKADRTGRSSTEPGIGNLYESIARRAYELYELRGSGPGDELTDWLMAEREILAGVTGLEATAADSTATTAAVDGSKLRRKSAKPASADNTGKKPGARTARSAGKPKGLHL